MAYTDYHASQRLVCDFTTTNGIFHFKLTSSSKDLKSVSDDHLKAVFHEKGYRPDHTYSDIRLGIGYASVAIAGLLAFGEYKLGYDRIKNEMAVGVVFFGILQLVYAFWASKVEKHAVYIGKHEKTGHKAMVRTSIEKYGVKYSATVTVVDRKGAILAERNVEGHANEWIDDNCHIVYDKFVALIAPAIGNDNVKTK